MSRGLGDVYKRQIVDSGDLKHKEFHSMVLVQISSHLQTETITVELISMNVILVIS